MLEMSQPEINAEVKCVMKELKLCIDHFGSTEVARLRDGIATVHTTMGYTYLKFRGTPQACIGDEDGILYDFHLLVDCSTKISHTYITQFAEEFQKYITKKLTFYPVE